MSARECTTGTWRAACLLTVTIGWLWGCAVPTVPSRVIYENPTDFVRLEPDPYAFQEITQTLHSHPADIDPEEMAGLLKGFSVQEHRNAVQRFFVGESPLEPVFRDEEVAWLAPRLSQALAIADPQERVAFDIRRTLRAERAIALYPGELPDRLRHSRVWNGVRSALPYGSDSRERI